MFDGSETREVLPIGSGNRAQFLAEIDRISAGGGTPLGASVHSGANALVHQYKKQLGYGEYRLIVITDGESSDDINYGVNEAVRYNIADLHDRLRHRAEPQPAPLFGELQERRLGCRNSAGTQGSDRRVRRLRSQGLPEVGNVIAPERFKTIGKGSSEPPPMRPGDNPRTRLYRLPRVEFDLFAENNF